MRIIAGSARGRRLQAPPGRTTRPILDSLKERVFNILGAAAVVDRTVWDLFAGAGSLGLEALSRGADRCLFVERDRDSYRVLERNVVELGFQDRATVRRGDATRPDSWAGADVPDLVFVDPPFPLVERRTGEVERLLEDLAGRLTASSAEVVLRTPSELEWRLPDGHRLREADRREHGVNALHFLRLR